jgi:hypothetical protein
VTVQDPERLINEHPRLDFGDRSLYYVCGTELPVLPRISQDARPSSSLWRGYIATFRLTADGRLELIRYEYPYSDISAHDVEQGFLTGNFSLVLRHLFSGPSIQVPFRDGYVVEDRSQWKIDNQELVVNVREVYNDAGLVVDFMYFYGHGWIPRSLVPSEYAGDLPALVGRSVIVEIVRHLPEQRNILLRMTQLAAPA